MRCGRTLSRCGARRQQAGHPMRIDSRELVTALTTPRPGTCLQGDSQGLTAPGGVEARETLPTDTRARGGGGPEASVAAPAGRGRRPGAEHRTGTLRPSNLGRQHRDPTFPGYPLRPSGICQREHNEPTEYCHPVSMERDTEDLRVMTGNCRARLPSLTSPEQGAPRTTHHGNILFHF